MRTVTNLFLLCSFVVVIAQGEVDLKVDKPYMKLQLSARAVLECCYSAATEMKTTWMKRNVTVNETRVLQNVTLSDNVISGNKKGDGILCGTLTFKSVQIEDSGLYQCRVKSVLSHGTFLHVYKPMEKTINLSENTKNKILTAEGILLFLCVLLPAATLLCQSKRLNELEKKKVKREEENIYQGLNLDDCCATYDQIERSQTHGPYQDVCTITEEEEEIQLEKP